MAKLTYLGKVIENFGMTKLQKKNFEAVCWLIDGSTPKKGIMHTSGQGKSYLLAYAFIQKAILNPNIKIYVADHTVFINGGNYYQKFFYETIKFIIQNNEYLKNERFELRLIDHTLCYRKNIREKK